MTSRVENKITKTKKSLIRLLIIIQGTSRGKQPIWHPKMERQRRRTNQRRKSQQNTTHQMKLLSPINRLQRKIRMLNLRMLQVKIASSKFRSHQQRRLQRRATNKTKPLPITAQSNLILTVQLTKRMPNNGSTSLIRNSRSVVLLILSRVIWDSIIILLPLVSLTVISSESRLRSMVVISGTVITSLVDPVA